MTRQTKEQAGKALPLRAVKRMPEVLGNASAVLWDKNKKNLSYVFDVPGNPKKGKFVVDVTFEFRSRKGEGGKLETKVINTVKTGGVVDRISLMQRDIYDVIEGEL